MLLSEALMKPTTVTPPAIVGHKPKLHCVGGSYGYFTPWEGLFQPCDSTKEADVVLFTGGEDIHPKLYGEKVVRSYFNEKRDDYEVRAFNHAVKARKPIIGICRGAQLVCALTGGRLFQHVDNHMDGHHEITTVDGRKFDMTSIHHQMMRPAKGEHELLAWTECRSAKYVSAEKPDYVGPNPDFNVDPEIVWFPKVKCIAIQGHPEYMGIESTTNRYLRELVYSRILEK